MIPIQNIASCLYDSRKLISQLFWEKQVHKNIWENTRKGAVSDTKIFYKGLILKTVQYSAHQQTTNEIESSLIDPNA